MNDWRESVQSKSIFAWINFNLTNVYAGGKEVEGNRSMSACMCMESARQIIETWRHVKSRIRLNISVTLKSVHAHEKAKSNIALQPLKIEWKLGVSWIKGCREGNYTTLFKEPHKRTESGQSDLCECVAIRRFSIPNHHKAGSKITWLWTTACRNIAHHSTCWLT